MKTLTPISIQLPTLGNRENELLLCCARTCMDSKNAKRLKILLQKNIDWDYLIEKANLHGVLPLLYWNLSNTCPEAVPSPILTQLQESFYAIAKYNLYQTSELLRLLDLFTANEIPAIPYKGPALAAFVYHNLVLRVFGDLDIIVPEPYIRKAKDLLLSQGYQVAHRTQVAAKTDYLHFECGDYYLVSSDGSVTIDLHWGITPSCIPFPLDLTQLWQRLESISLGGTTVLHFQPEDLLLILCVHGTKDYWRQLKWLCDIAALIRVHQSIDWERVFEQASYLGVERILWLGLLLVNDLLGVTLPKKIWQRIQQSDQIVKQLAAQICKRFLYSHEKVIGFEEFLYFCLIKNWDEQSFKRWRMRKGWNIVWFAFAPSDKDRLLISLPTYLSFLYYLIRPVRIAIQYGRSALSRLKSSCGLSIPLSF